ncbi:MAG: hypothetical protein WCL61_01855 [bacterium]
MAIEKKLNKAYVLTVDMGYGHQRASYPLHTFAEGGIITANNYEGIPESDKKIWMNSRAFYEFISRFKKIPFIGEKVFSLYDKFQEIPIFYPKRDMSKPNFPLKQIYKFFKNGDWGKHLIKKLAKKPLPLVTTFFATALMAEYFDYPEDIYCVICDADVSRTWVSLDPHASRINYLAPCKRVVERLKLYGVPPQRIFLTGFPLPDENVGLGLKIIKEDLGRRLIQLDPEKIYINSYRETINEKIGRTNLLLEPTRPLTITFSVGGAGAQREMGMSIVKSFKRHIMTEKVKINLIAGTNVEISDYFKAEVKKMGLDHFMHKTIDVIHDNDKTDYFKKFNRVLRDTDVLWTKPSELTFYSGLGLPIIMCPPIGSQEVFNQRWLESIGSGIKQDDPQYVNEWIYDWLNSGWLAEAAMQGFMEAPKYGTYNIKEIIFNKARYVKEVDTVMQF